MEAKLSAAVGDHAPLLLGTRRPSASATLLSHSSQPPAPKSTQQQLSRACHAALAHSTHEPTATMRALLLTLLLAAVALTSGLTDQGIIYLDDLTFDRIVDGSKDVFVRFDKEYPWGDAHDAFKELAAKVGEADTSLLVVGVPISNSADYPANSKLSARFGMAGLSDADFPRFKLFKAGAADLRKPLDYTGEAKAAAMLAWTLAQTGVYMGVKGQVKELDGLARAFMAAPASERPALLAQAQAAANGIDASAKPDLAQHIEAYIRTMSRILERGDKYVEQETQRLTKMSEDKAVAAAKRETFAWRLNTLASFTTKPLPGTEKAEL